jgi:hypothetical protein
MAGVSAGLQGPLVAGTDECNLGRKGQCLDDFPFLTRVALVTGREGGSRGGIASGATISALAGPAYISRAGRSRRGRSGLRLQCTAPSRSEPRVSERSPACEPRIGRGRPQPPLAFSLPSPPP